jgi:hypothetical protein
MRVVSVFLRHRPLIASTGLLALAGLLAAVHRPIHNDAPEPAPLTVAEAGIHGTGVLLLDLVEPEDGEGGSEAELAATPRPNSASPTNPPASTARASTCSASSASSPPSPNCRSACRATRSSRSSSPSSSTA